MAGYRAGAGRPKGKGASVIRDARRAGSPLDYLLEVMRDPDADAARRDRAAIAALPYLHSKPAPEGAKARAQRLATEEGAAASWDRLLS